jgi:PBP1b-binding outer membrane lipoprotein LpoB
MNRYWIVILLVLLAGCQKPHPTSNFSVTTSGTNTQAQVVTEPVTEDKSSPSCMCDPDALKQAVLDRIFDSGIGQPLYNDMQGSKYEGTLTTAKLEDGERLIDKLRRYSSKLTDTCLKNSYLDWISFYQAQYDEGTNALAHPEAAPSDDYKERQKEKDREVEECKRKGTVPAIKGIS